MKNLSLILFLLGLTLATGCGTVLIWFFPEKIIKIYQKFKRQPTDGESDIWLELYLQVSYPLGFLLLATLLILAIAGVIK